MLHGVDLSDKEARLKMIEELLFSEHLSSRIVGELFAADMDLKAVQIFASHNDDPASLILGLNNFYITLLCSILYRNKMIRRESMEYIIKALADTQQEKLDAFVEAVYSGELATKNV